MSYVWFIQSRYCSNMRLFFQLRNKNDAGGAEGRSSPLRSRRLRGRDPLGLLRRRLLWMRTRSLADARGDRRSGEACQLPYWMGSDCRILFIQASQDEGRKREARKVREIEGGNMKALFGLVILFSTFGVTVLLGATRQVGMDSAIVIGSILLFSALALLTQRGSPAFRRRLRQLRKEGSSS